MRLYSVREFTRVSLPFALISPFYPTSSSPSISPSAQTHRSRAYPSQSTDPFHASVPINTWSLIEIHIGIYCASIPSLKALFSKAQRQRTQNTLGHGYMYHGSERSGGKSGGSRVGVREIIGSGNGRGKGDVREGEEVEMGSRVGIVRGGG